MDYSPLFLQLLPSFVCYSPKLSRAVISGRQSPVTAGDTIRALILPVSDMTPAGCSLFPDRSVTRGDICTAVSLSLSVAASFWHVSLGKGGCSGIFCPLLDGLVVTNLAQAVGGILLLQSSGPLDISTPVAYLSILL